MTRRAKTRHPVRNAIVLFFLLGGIILLAARAVYLQVFNSDFLQNQGNQRHSRLVKDNSHRGMILDRHGSPLAVSTPVDSVWAHPSSLSKGRRHWSRLAAMLEMHPRELAQLVRKYEDREFMYLKRHVPPPQAERVMALQISGVALQREYRRYYPLGSVAGHVIGFTNIDDQGQEGVELAYNTTLRAVPGAKRLLRDLQGKAVEVAESVVLPKPGRDLVLSIDRRIQYLAYRELKAAVSEHGARAGSAIVLDARTGEVLALVNEPDFNPNNRAGLRSGLFRNRAVTDLFEPGSTLKPFTIASALESGKYSPGSIIDTTPGTLQVGDRLFRDIHNYGVLTVAGIIEKSSNVGISKIALSLNKKNIWEMLHSAGFGQATGIQLPGEVVGLLNPYSKWVPVDQASISFGYGISVTPLQLARAYLALANNGIALPLTLQHSDAIPKGERIMSTDTARRIQSMLELAVGDIGTGRAAQVADYRVAGKTGTVRKLTPEGYSDDKYVAWFAGFAPVVSPRLVMVVTVDEPVRGGYYGGVVAAPVFGRVMTGALRLLDVPPDAPRPETRLITVKSERVVE
ncbi:MAG: penicillin-binding protein 2 [Gammaproteobacteria bacterium]|nr:penicillin-binding protein 2 [Gammaproteobacteria bacterium]MDH3370292.1 penicillin-binding protein 2 [Gammaproteobacteria bacterium]MDH3406075.1 penicillin-binding protein 2 [Gammaproteobacteria bacterium]MDH5486151.1 penicillin-binding protein 2 [Gammaproteobacteria bacterium]